MEEVKTETRKERKLEAAAVAELVAQHSSVKAFAIAFINLVVARIDELAERPSVDMVELQAVSNELKVSGRQLTEKIKEA
jgi:hypothetical protein